jgi:uncharacterized protein
MDMLRAMKNRIVRFEIGCKNAETTKGFYGSLFDWKLAAAPMGFAVDTGEAPAGAIMALGHEPHHYTMFYVEVADVAAALAKATELGGKTLVGPVPLPHGSFAWFADPEGNTVGLWQPR